MADLFVYTLAADLLTCATNALNNKGVLPENGGPAENEGAPDRRYVFTGQPVHDDCCDGQLAVTVLNIFPSYNPPGQPTAQPLQSCGWPLTSIVMQVEVVRCAPVFSDANGGMPTVAALDASAKLALADGRALWRGVLCCLAVRKDLDATGVNQEYLRLGGCMYSRLNVVLSVIDGCVC